MRCDAGGEAFGGRLKPQRRAPLLPVETPVIQKDVRTAGYLRAGDTAVGATHPPHLEQIGKVTGKSERQPDLARTLAVVMNAQPLIGRIAPQEYRADDVQDVLGQHKLVVEIDVGIGQVDGQRRIVVAHARTQQQRLVAVEKYLQVREIPCVGKENSVRSAHRRADVGVCVKHGEAVAVLEGAPGPCGSAGGRNVEGRFRAFLDRGNGCALAKQRVASR